ncbi:ABC transporter ATP-binding protein [Pseudomonas sp. 273]|uniref:ABC transporter ATP-binding protein n=1 Tax=Pseudomonas sp. 273 TaxID=75692 RepID=UPI0023D80F7A|nr:ABC transporter ATP-binding protein [Pseudomonas sp. 273]
MSGKLLEVRDLRIDLPAGGDRAHAVQDLSMALDAGEVLCVVGESGSGKSMLANAILRLLPTHLQPVAGSIRWHGEDLAGRSEEGMRQLRGKDIAMVFQEPMSALNPLLSIGRQLDETLRAHGVASRSQRRARILELLGYVGLPDPPTLYHAYPFQLSGGQRQRVVIAIALALEPALLIADEPTSALDVSSQARILELLRRIQREKGMAVLLITHDFAVVEAIADRVLVMEKGQAVEQGPLRRVLDAPAHPYTRRLLAALHMPARVARRVDGEALPQLEARGLYKTYASRQGLWRRRQVAALEDASFALRPGESLGIVGESGSGKTTLGRALVRLLRPDAGELLLRGEDLAQLSQRRLRPLRKHIQMVFQDPYASLNPRQCIGAQVMAGALAQGVPATEAERRARGLLQQVGLPESAFERYPKDFSGGQRQRIGIARALAVQPQILVADECVSALDALVQQQVLELLEQLQRELGLTLVFITHDLRVAARLCDRIAVMQGGRIVELGETGQVLRVPSHPYTRSLLAAQPGEALAGAMA